MTIKDYAKLLIPPILIHCYRALLNGIKNSKLANYNIFLNHDLLLSGDYPTWSSAVDDSTGYETEIILEKTKVALLKVKNGKAEFERDSFLLNEIQYSWPLLAGLLSVAARCQGTLNVLDFGGSLGSTYFQNRKFLSQLCEVRWNIIEQPHYVEVGKEMFEDSHLRFYYTIADCLVETRPNVVLLSGVLQYLEQPFEVLGEVLRVPCDNLIIDRTPFWAGSADRLCVQHVPAEIYPASYPSWIFSTDNFIAKLNAPWKIVAEFTAIDKFPAPVETSYKGLIATRQNNL